MKNIWQRIHWYFKNGSYRDIHQQLQWQRYLLQKGTLATAQVLDKVEERRTRQGYVQMRFWVMLRVKGTVTYRHIQTLLEKEQVPGIGDRIQILYCPEDLSKVLIM